MEICIRLQIANYLLGRGCPLSYLYIRRSRSNKRNCYRKTENMTLRYTDDLVVLEKTEESMINEKENDTKFHQKRSCCKIQFKIC